MYGAFPEILFAIMGELDDSFDRVMLVGHNPGISQFAERLSTEYLGDFPTCALARLDFSVSSWRSIVPRTGFPGLFEYPKKRNTPRKEAPE
jgi:phosphohistidine phosphatase